MRPCGLKLVLNIEILFNNFKIIKTDRAIINIWETTIDGTLIKYVFF